MGDYEAIIMKAELMAMSPEAVDAFLKRRAADIQNDRYDSVDEGVEAALLSRDHPLINLALAKGGRFFGTLKPLFDAGESASAIRLSVLSNSVAERYSFSFRAEFPVYLFGKEEDVVAWVAAAPDEELMALFENPSLGDSFLRSILEGGKDSWAIPDDVLARIVFILCDNERMRRPYDDENDVDGSATYHYDAVFDAAWSLASRVPTVIPWPAALSQFFNHIVLEAFSIKTPLEIAIRWHPDPADAKAVAQESEDLKSGCWLGGYSGVRRGLARLALGKDSKLLPSLLSSDDAAFRAAAYSDGSITPDQIRAAFERDGELAVNHPLRNEKLWRNDASRFALQTIAQESSHPLSSYEFWRRQSEMEEKNPEWFEEPAPEVDPMDRPATKADLKAMTDHLGGRIEPMDGLRQVVGALAGAVVWAWLFSLAALVATVFRLHLR